MQERTQVSTTPPLTGIDLVAQVNAALQTIATDFSGAVDPAADAWPYASWADTGTGRLRRRNSANNAWVDIGPLLAEGVTPVDGALMASQAWVINHIANLITPPGGIGYFASKTVEPGWLKANGAAVSVTAYAVLTSRIYVGDAANASAPWGYRCTDPANPASTRSITGGFIVLPDMRGEFPRGWDDARGVDVGRAFGSSQAESVNSAGILLREAFATWAGGGSFAGGSVAYFGNSPNATYGSSRAVFGGVETRGRNVALLACIKF